MAIQGIPEGVELPFRFAVGDSPVLAGVPCRIVECLFRSKGSKGQVLRAYSFPNCTRGHCYYVAETPDGEVWIKQVFTLVGGRQTPFADLESEYACLRRGSSVSMRSGNCCVRGVSPVGFARFEDAGTACQCILMEYLKDHRRYVDVRRSWGVSDRRKLLELLAKWLDAAKISVWDSVPTNLMVRGSPEAFEVVPIDLAIGLPFSGEWLAELERKM